MSAKFSDSDEFGILGNTNAASAPYFAVKLTKEQAEAVSDMIVGIYEIDGKQLFDVKDDNGNSTGEKMFYAVFV